MVYNLMGGGGQDRMRADAVDVVLGSAGLLSMRLDGGAGADNIAANASIRSAGLNSQVKMTLLGGEGDDKLALGFAGSPSLIQLLVDGGAGTDRCEVPAGLAPPQLIVINCER